MENGKNLCVTSLTRIVSFSFYQHQSFYNQKQKGKHCGIRLSTDGEQRQTGNVQKQGKFIFILYPYSRTAILKGKTKNST